jgi:hypothetical protein
MILTGTCNDAMQLAVGWTSFCPLQRIIAITHKQNTKKSHAHMIEKSDDTMDIFFGEERHNGFCLRRGMRV